MGHVESMVKPPLILGEKTHRQISEDIARIALGRATRGWYIALTISVLALLWGAGCIAYTIGRGVGLWGINTTVNWGWAIINFVWWIGIGHAGTLISAILLLFRQKWRNAINRSAEAMTIFAVICAGLMPLIHMGRVWVAYWTLPLPNRFGSLWVNLNSPLFWDVCAITTYFTVSLVFWYLGLLPDFATIRDLAKSKIQRFVYTILSFGWAGDVRSWVRHEEVSLILAGLATPLVFSVHSIVSTDFATSLIPGWHTTIFPPYFVIGAVFSGFAMVQMLLIVTRKLLALEDYITIHHVEYINFMMLVTGTLLGSGYIAELFMAWYSGVEYERYVFLNRMFGPYWWSYWLMMGCNVIAPQLFWIKRIRTSFAWSLILSIVVNIGMWMERFVIVVTALHRDFLPSSWDMYYPTHIDIGIYVGTFGLFFTCFLLFAKYFPIISISEVKAIYKSTGEKEKEKHYAMYHK